MDNTTMTPSTTPSTEPEICDSLPILFKKTEAIITVNKESLNFIESRKGQKVILKHRYSLEVTDNSFNTRQVSDKDGTIHDGQLLNLVDNKITKAANDVVENWRYGGEGLTRETICFKTFIDLKLNDYNDLRRVHNDFEKLLDKYKRILKDEPESRNAVHELRRNAERIQIAIGEIHTQILDVNDPIEGNEVVVQRIQSLSRDLQSLQRDFPRICLNLNFTKLVQNETGKEIPSFNDVTAMSLVATLSQTNARIRAVKSFSLNGKKYLASIQAYGKITLWDLESHGMVGALDGHDGCINSLVPYVQNGLSMLASCGADKTIKLWDMEYKSLVQTLYGHTRSVTSLETCKKGDKTILISGSADKTIRVYDLDDYELLAELTGHSRSVQILRVFYLHDEYFLASGSNDKTIKIWNLNDHQYSLESVLSGHDGPILSLEFITSNETSILASGDWTGYIKLWNMETCSCINTLGHPSVGVFGLQGIQCCGFVCLASGSKDGGLQFWNLDDYSVITPLSHDVNITSLDVFVYDNKPCLVSGDSMGTIKVWTER